MGKMKKMEDVIKFIPPKEGRLISTPNELDQQLHKKIIEYAEKNSMSKLHKALNEYIRDQFEPSHELILNKKIRASELESYIKKHIPSAEYLKQYSAGRPICYRYTNAIANFFEVDYQLVRHDPCKEFLQAIK